MPSTSRSRSAGPCQRRQTGRNLAGRSARRAREVQARSRRRSTARRRRARPVCPAAGARRATSSTIATTPTASTSRRVCPSCPASSTARSKKLCPPPATPNRLGSWVMAMVKPGADLEADEDAVADQLDQRAQPQQPGDQAERRHGEGGEAGDLRVALRVPVGHRADRAGDHQRDGGGRPDRQLARRAEQRVAEPAQTGSRRRRPAAAGRQASHRRARPGSRRPRASRRRRRHPTARRRGIPPASGPPAGAAAPPLHFRAAAIPHALLAMRPPILTRAFLRGGREFGTGKDFSVLPCARSERE